MTDLKRLQQELWNLETEAGEAPRVEAMEQLMHEAATAVGRLAHIESQTLYRDESMPAGAIAFGRFGEPVWFFADGSTKPAPDKAPDRHGLFWLPIIDPPEGK